MVKVRIVLVESALELVPREIINHPAVVKNARRRGKRPSEVLLDVSIHYAAMKNLPNRFKRGRPDIVHISLLNALSSPLNIEGYLEFYIHTIQDQVIFVNPKMRPPRDYRRFIGLMEQLLVTGKVPPDSDEPLMYIKTLTVKDLVKKLNIKHVILLSEKGELVTPDEVASLAIRGDTAIFIGGFAHGDFGREVYEVASDILAIYPKPLDAWIVVSRIIEACERKLKVYSFRLE
ncbi:MAG TPA: 16S rRNA methyltransferase [Desulfurococcales archaeon]|nr:16S rRNA methyltransferase [Desulfurococcales archaeon]